MAHAPLHEERRVRPLPHLRAARVRRVRAEGGCDGRETELHGRAAPPGSGALAEAGRGGPRLRAARGVLGRGFHVAMPGVASTRLLFHTAPRVAARAQLHVRVARALRLGGRRTAAGVPLAQHVVDVEDELVRLGVGFGFGSRFGFGFGFGFGLGFGFGFGLGLGLGLANQHAAHCAALRRRRHPLQVRRQPHHLHRRPLPSAPTALPAAAAAAAAAALTLAAALTAALAAALAGGWPTHRRGGRAYRVHLRKVARPATHLLGRRVSPPDALSPPAGAQQRRQREQRQALGVCQEQRHQPLAHLLHWRRLRVARLPCLRPSARARLSRLAALSRSRPARRRRRRNRRRRRRLRSQWRCLIFRPAPTAVGAAVCRV